MSSASSDRSTGLCRRATVYWFVLLIIVVIHLSSHIFAVCHSHALPIVNKCACKTTTLGLSENFNNKKIIANCHMINLQPDTIKCKMKTQKRGHYKQPLQKTLEICEVFQLKWFWVTKSKKNKLYLSLQWEKFSNSLCYDHFTENCKLSGFAWALCVCWMCLANLKVFHRTMEKAVLWRRVTELVIQRTAATCKWSKHFCSATDLCCSLHNRWDLKTNWRKKKKKANEILL